MAQLAAIVELALNHCSAVAKVGAALAEQVEALARRVEALERQRDGEK
jgi:hypothetical protein